MAEEKKIPFMELFSAWRPEPALLPALRACMVTGAVIDRGARTLQAELECPLPLGEGVRTTLEGALAAFYRLTRVELLANNPVSVDPAVISPP